MSSFVLLWAFLVLVGLATVDRCGAAVERLLTQGIEISHTSPHITASLQLVCTEDSELSRALLALAPAGTTPYAGV